MTRDKAFEIVSSAIEEYSSAELDEIQLTSDLSCDLDIDSLELVQICIVIEERIKKDVEPPSLNTLKTVEDLVKIIEVYEYA